MRLPSSAEEAEALGGLAGKVRALDPPLPVAVVAVPRGGDAADRGAAAARDIEAGELVCVEEPFAWVPGGDAAGAVCHACASVLGEARPEGCAACEMAVYCSAGCRERHSEVHAAECALLKALPGIAAESGASADLVRIAARVAVRGAVPGGGAERAGRAFRASMADVREMASHVEEQDEERTESMRMAAAMALPLLPLAVRSSTRAADLVTLMSVVNSNAHTVCPDTAPEQALGVGLYPLSSVFNHSCEPNVVFVTEGGGGARLAYRAIRDIAAGEELCVNYVDLCAPTEARRRALLDASHFLCRCDRCEGVPRSADELRRFGNGECPPSFSRSPRRAAGRGPGSKTKPGPRGPHRPCGGARRAHTTREALLAPPRLVLVLSLSPRRGQSAFHTPLCRFVLTPPPLSARRRLARTRAVRVRERRHVWCRRRRGVLGRVRPQHERRRGGPRAGAVPAGGGGRVARVRGERPCHGRRGHAGGV